MSSYSQPSGPERVAKINAQAVEHLFLSTGREFPKTFCEREKLSSPQTYSAGQRVRVGRAYFKEGAGEGLGVPHKQANLVAGFDGPSNFNEIRYFLPSSCPNLYTEIHLQYSLEPSHPSKPAMQACSWARAK